MAQRKVATRSGPSRRASGHPAGPGPGTGRARKTAKTRAAAGAKPAAGRSARKPSPRSRPEKPASAARRMPPAMTARGAAQPGGRRTVELFDRAQDDEDAVPTLPSSLDFDQRPSAARSGRAELEERYREHPETSPGLTAGDIDADWQAAYSVGDEAPGGDNPTPGQVVVEDVGRALGIEYDVEEELKGAEKIAIRDRHRWELDPASSEDYPERTKGARRKKR